MKIAELLDHGVDTNVPVCAPDQPLQDAIESMWLWGCESLPVCESDGGLVGVVSMRTICLRAHITGKRLEELLVRDVTSRERLACREDESVARVMERMCRSHLWHLPVVDSEDRLLGVVSYATLLDSTSNTTRDTLNIVPRAAPEGEADADLDALAGGWTLLLKQRELVSPTGERTHLSQAERRLLTVFASQPGQVLSRNALMRQVCNRDWVPSDRYIDVLVASLRRKFGERASDAQIIRTIHNDGYVFTPRVAQHGAVEAEPVVERRPRPPRRSGRRQVNPPEAANEGS
ncbi:MAG: winged helix-turn-helix domain-containing protein [Pseudomonadota bacterium]